MPPLRANPPAHTTSSDGVERPARLVAAYEALGYDFLAITDHEDRIGASYWRALLKLSSRLLLFPRVELNWPEFDQHIGRVLGDRETLHVLNHLARYKLSIGETVERTRVIGRDGLT